MAMHRTLHGASFPPPLPPGDPLRDPLREAVAQHGAVPHDPHAQHPARIVLIVVLVLLTLAGLAYGGGVAVDRILEQRRVVALMGPKARLATLPEIEVPLGESRAVEMRVSLVLAPKVEAERILRYQDRIADRLFQTVSEAGTERLTGTGSASFLKQTVRDAVRREAGDGLIRDVYIERMVVK